MTPDLRSIPLPQYNDSQSTACGNKIVVPNFIVTGQKVAHSVGHNLGIEQQNVLLAEAKQAVSTFHSALEDAIARTRIQQYEALTAVYRLHISLTESPEIRRMFYHSHGIVQDPRSKYLAQPIILHLTSSFTDVTRVKASYWSGAIAWAERNHVAPDDFQKFIQSCDGGIQGSYKAEVAARKGKTDREGLVRTLLAATAAYETENPAEIIQETSFLKNADKGRYLLIAEVDDQGNPKIIARLNRSYENVEALYDEHITSWHDTRGRGHSTDE